MAFTKPKKPHLPTDGRIIPDSIPVKKCNFCGKLTRKYDKWVDSSGRHIACFECLYGSADAD